MKLNVDFSELEKAVQQMKPKTNTEFSLHNNTLHAEQLVIGMSIIDPLEPSNIITITELIAVSTETIGLGCDKGYVSLDINHTFQLAKPFNQPITSSNWIKKQLEEENEMDEEFKDEKN